MTLNQPLFYHPINSHIVTLMGSKGNVIIIECKKGTGVLEIHEGRR